MVGERPRRPTEPIEILVAEDNPGDVRLIKKAFDDIDRETTLHIVSDGYGAISYLNQQAATEPVSLPDLALLDLNLPGKDGCEVLETIRDDPQLKPLTVIILTSSDNSEDITRCYNAHANAYITKPVNPDSFMSMIASLEQFWFTYAARPPTTTM
ncbi:response regulator [Natrialbaceae archaeon A-arb3/5]